MQDLVNFFMLGGAIAASLTGGVLAAHVLCRTAFALVRMHTSSVANARLDKASVPS